MASAESSNNIYTKLEDKWYGFLDKINSTIPIYGIIDPIDKIIPSFMLFLLGIVFLLIVAGVFGILLLAPGGPQTGELRLEIIDETGAGIDGAYISITNISPTASGYADGDGKITLKVPAETDLEVEISKGDYESEDRTLKVKGAKLEKTITLRLLLTSSFPKTIKFTGPDGKKIVNKEIRVEFSCSTGKIMEQSEFLVNSGEITITPPQGCGILSANVISDGYLSNSYSITNSGEIISLEREDVPEGGILIHVRDAENNNPLSGIHVTIRDDAGIKKEGITQTGELNLTLEVGSYYASFSDDTLNYATKTINFTITEGDIESITARLTKDVKAFLRVRVIDDNNDELIPRAKIVVRDGDGKTIDEQISDFNGNVVSFPIEKNGLYYISASAEDYVMSGEREVDLTAKSDAATVEETIALESCTPATCGRVRVRVYDEDRLAVENARVSFYNAETGFLVAALGTEITDVNGEAEFTGIPSGEYYAIAQKYPSSGTSETKAIAQSEVTEFTVWLEIGDGVLEIKARDDDGMPVPFAFAELKSEGGEELGIIPLDAEGYGAYPSKADKRLYVRVYAEGYTSWTSTAQQIVKGQTVSVDAILVEEILGDSPSAELIGVFREGSKSAVDKLEAGKTYIARFSITVPSETDFEYLGLHVRTGQMEKLEKDQIFINYVNAPNASVIKATTYTPPNGYSFDELHVTNGDAKWANAVFGRWVNPGIYNVEVELKVRADTTPGYVLPLHYRVWAVTEDNEFLRAPYDEELGFSESAAGKHALYAKAFDKFYVESAPEICDDDFCYSERVIDISQDLILGDSPYALNLFDDFNVVFSITNNSRTVHNDSNLRLKNTMDGATVDDTLSIESYRVTNADEESFSSDLPVYEFADSIDLGNFTQNKSVRGSLVLKPKKVGESQIQVRVVSDMAQVFEKIIPFTVYSSEDLNVSVWPDNLPAFVDIALRISVELEGGDDDGLEIEDAFVRVTRIAPDKSETEFSDFTSPAGEANFTIPASSPGTKIIVEVEKAGHKSEKITKEISRNIIEFKPKTLESNLDVSDITEEFLELELKNLVPPTLKIVELRFSGNFQGLLDEEKMGNWLQQYEQYLELEHMDVETIQVQTAISDEAKLITKNKELAGSLLIDVNNLGDTASYPFVVPVTVNVSLGQKPSNAPCITVSLKEWKDSALEEKISREFEIENNCLNKNNEPMQLRNLQARIVWKGNNLGNVELLISDPENGSQSEILKETVYTTFFEGIPPEHTYNATLSFTPKVGHLGETAKFDVEIDAELITSSGNQLVGASNSVDAELLIINLSKCIKFDPNPEMGIKIDSDEEETEFSIDTSGCGDIDIDLKFCDSGRDNCRGGASEGSILVHPWSFTDVSSGDEKTVRVTRQEIPGIYGINIDARPAGGGFRQVAVMDVIIEPDGHSFFEMGKYDFSIVGDGAMDATTLYNHMVEEQVYVRADQCSWGTAIDNQYWGAAGLLMSAAGAGMIAASAMTVGAATTVTYASGLVISNAVIGAGSQIIGGTVTATGYSGAPLGLTYSSASPMALSGGVVETVPGTTLGSSTTAGSTSMGALGAQLLAVGLIILILYLTGIIGPADCEDVFLTNPLPDYVVNLAGTDDLPADARAIIMDRGEIDSEFNLDVRDIYAEGAHNTEEVGMVFTNEGISEGEPVYSLARVRFTEHIHGDDSHSDSASDYDVECSNGSFAPYWIGGESSQGSCNGVREISSEEKFHLRFKTLDMVESLPEVNFDTFACANGLQIGRSGEGALPRVKLNWEWTEPKGIAYDECDSGNADYIYCDAAQFTIETNKRLKRLYEFLQANNFDLRCPKQIESTGIKGFNDTNSTHAVEPDSIGLQSISATKTVNSAQVVATVRNNNAIPAGATVHIILTGQGAPSLECDALVVGLAQNGAESASCNFTPLEETVYVATAIISASNVDIDTTPVSVGFIIGESGVALDCELPRTTETLYGEPMINRFIDADQTVNWTSAIPNKETLNDLLKFNAYLIKDSYSPDFMNDFVNYYTSSPLADTPTFFTDYEFDRIMRYGALQVRQKYIESYQLSAPGLYDVEIAAYFDDDWRFIDVDGNVSVSVAVVLQHIDDPSPNSPFYSMPFDGLVGLEGNSFNRQLYGAAFINENIEDLVRIDENETPLNTFPDTGSNPVATVKVEIEDSIYNLNSALGTRGEVLAIENKSGGVKELTFSPSLATPVMLKASSEITDEPLSVFYGASVNDATVEVGGTLTYWSGAGSCLDFSGVPVYEAFDEKPDRAATDKDRLQFWTTIYGVDWANMNYSGDVYLRTIFYSSPEGDSLLQATYPLDQMEFLTPDETGDSVALNGISTMAYNGNDTINSIQDVFDLVGEGQLCATNSGNKTTFWWNPQDVYLQQGSRRSIHGLTEGLAAGESCIGFD
ncbi:MAG: carboxypeptidase-like regulatory domain-containing protein [Candidatus Diapherotrites archaeon]